MKKKHQNQKQKRNQINNNLDVLYMQDVINDIKVIEEDLENVEKKCEKVNCGALYDAIIAAIKLIYDLLFCCCKKKNQK